MIIMENVSQEITIVGGGPAGSTAAIFLAREGVKVRLFEKSPDRAKICAGSIGGRAVTEFGEFFDCLDSFPVKEMILNIEGAEVRIDRRNSNSMIIDRLSFDKQLRAMAKEAGATIIKKKLTRMPEEELVIDARGFKKPEKNATVFRGFSKTKKYDNMFIMVKRDLIEMGYFWIFPMSNNLVNVGLGGYVDKMRDNPKHMLDVFCKKRGLELFNLAAAPVYLDGRIEKLVDTNIIKVGESAGLVNPLTGEGIYHAMKSARILVNCILDDRLQDYERMIKKEFDLEFQISRMARFALKLRPKIQRSLFKIGKHIISRL
jgi:flavin-dependent dehydrogenase